MDQHQIKECFVLLDRNDVAEYISKYKASRANAEQRLRRVLQPGISKPTNGAQPSMKQFLCEIVEKSKKFKRCSDIVDLTEQRKSFKLEQVQLRRASDRILPALPPKENTLWDEFHHQITTRRQEANDD